jgi:hypothetical protein
VKFVKLIFVQAGVSDSAIIPETLDKYAAMPDKTLR